MAVKRGLGKGLGALIKDGTTPASTPQGDGIARLRVDSIHKSRLQPRRRFDPEPLAELTESIREHGVLQPLLVRAAEDGYELIAGERRLTAAVNAGLTEVPAVVVEAADRDALQLALVENLQREDLNAIEEAEGYRLLADRFNMTQDSIATRVGKARASVANALRLLDLPEKVRDHVAEGRLTAGHAKALAALDISEEQVLLADKAVQQALSVRQLENRVRRALSRPHKPRASRDDIPATHLSDVEEELQRRFGTRVKLTSSRTYANGKKGRGSIEIEYYSPDDLDRILADLGFGSDV